MSKWSKLYEKEIKEMDVKSYIKEKLRTKDTIIKLINKYAISSKIMEVGSGTGILSLKLATMGNNVVALDSDADMIALSKKYFLKEFDCPNIKYVNKDIREYNEKEMFDVIYSIGILEHYSDDEIVELLNKQLLLADYVIFGIPTKYFDEKKKMYGNERYLKIRYWKNLIKRSRGVLIEESHYHYLKWYQRVLK